ncbi:hypothetical protein EYF80_028414 [Liparis tanakae]|uniref:Uncharacterized protein n=1 Tax=Liparis tanakae TaxID=230148 RepID=A0A4Z2H680_9TELE|nr:hypothetical protein EYF80_028414 [Liparis tanakae]
MQPWKFFLRKVPGLPGSGMPPKLSCDGKGSRERSIERVPLPFGVEVLRVGVHREVDLLVEALYVDRVPLLVVQQAAHGDGHAAAAGPQPAVVCRSTEGNVR